jgi:hypothetical protein
MTINTTKYISATFFDLTRGRHHQALQYKMEYIKIALPELRSQFYEVFVTIKHVALIKYMHVQWR